MKIQTTKLATNRTISGEPPRSTAYYYADLERIKRKNEEASEPHQNPDELSEYVASNEVVNDGPIREVPPLRDRMRQFSLPEYTTQDRKVAGETYSTAGTFPMPEPKEKEPLLAELEVVGRLPLTQLDSSTGVRRSRSWYLCCPNMGDEEISRESSWRYSSLRPVTAPPIAGQNGLISTVATQSSGRGDDLSALRAERDALSRALAAERQRAATAARAHDARLAELHGVIAELVRRRAGERHRGAIPEEEVSDECESTTQPAGELDNDADRSRTDQNDTSSLVSPAELPTPQDPKVERHIRDDTTDTSERELSPEECEMAEQPVVVVSSPQPPLAQDNCDTSLNLSERDSDLCLTTARCCRQPTGSGSGMDSCERERGSNDVPLYTASTGRCESRQAKLASRVRLRKTGEDTSNNHLSNEEAWCLEAAEKLALDVGAQADLREAFIAATNDGLPACGAWCAWRVRGLRLAADLRVAQCALARATDTAHRLYTSCSVQESSCVALCGALRAADRCLEAYDVLLALAETSQGDTPEREAAELVARQLLARLDGEDSAANVGEPLLSPGPWLRHHHQMCTEEKWDSECEQRLRSHAARLKAHTVELRTVTPPPHLFSYHDIDEKDLPKQMAPFSMAEMEAAVMMQEMLTARESRTGARASEVSSSSTNSHNDYKEHKTESARSRRRRERHWLETQASETDL